MTSYIDGRIPGGRFVTSRYSIRDSEARLSSVRSTKLEYRVMNREPGVKLRYETERRNLTHHSHKYG